jgi:hypothetical protein
VPLVLEGIVTTLNDDASPNVSPMGPVVDRSFSYFTLKPFNTSQTYANLKRHPEGVLHVTDNVEMLARAAVNQLPLPDHFPAKVVAGNVLADACRWFEFKVSQWDDQQQRASVRCDVVHQGQLREFFGFNRAKHAVVEVAILATRIGIIPDQLIHDEFERLKVMIDKTGGDQEERAFQFLVEHVKQRLGK